MKKQRLLILTVLLAALLLLLPSCGKSEGPAPFEVTYQDRTYTIDPTAQTITDGDQTCRYFKIDGCVGIVYPDQTVCIQGQDPLGDTLISVLYKAENRAFPHRRSLHFDFFSISYIVLGTLHIALPRKAWYWQYGWHYKNAEPSEAALTWERVAGVLCLMIGLYILFNG